MAAMKPHGVSAPSHLPPDPEEMNDSRADWAESALVTFRHVTGTDKGDALTDLLCDLKHWADRYGADFHAELARADLHYAAETESP